MTTVGGGAALAAGDGELAGMPGVTLPLVCLTAAAAGVVRRYIAQQEQRIRRLFSQLARQQAERERELDRREADLAQREEVFQRTRFTTELRVRSAYGRMDMMLDELTAERAAHQELKAEYDELAREYNEVLLESAGALPAEVHHPPVAVGQIGTAGNARGPRRIPQRRGPRPFLSVVDSAGEYQESG
ncbi:hypothetical protein [Streptomyces afghaniensis]|uniref:hypothetical protein n=1 Tax=Streptomyces afghaniensis TaxID=66865 RepID=UPI0027D7EF40|nr:hypothetical protein [Streptomyces afghaniensis]